MLYLCLATGGVAGTLARYGLGRWIAGWAGTDFPWHTFAINLIGSLLLGAFMRAAQTLPFTPEVRALVTVGFCGAFTTFSTFALETVTLLQEGAWTRAALYAAASVLLGVAGVFLGMLLAGTLVRPAR